MIQNSENPLISPLYIFLIFISLSFPSSSSIQLYDLGSPAESSNTLPGCSLIDDHCASMEQPPSCGKRGRCHGEWGSFSCLCEKGFTGPRCDQGKHVDLRLSYFKISTKCIHTNKETPWCGKITLQYMKCLFHSISP